MKTAVKNIILFFIFIVYSISSHAQTAWIDSAKKVLATQREDTNKVNTLINLSFSYEGYYADTGLAYAQQALDLAKKLHFEKGIFWAQICSGGALMILGNYPLDLDYCFKALTLAKKRNVALEISFANGYLADCYFFLGEYNTSLSYEREVIKIAEQFSSDKIYFAWIAMSRAFEGMGQADSAILYAKKAYERIKRNPTANDVSFISPVLGNAFVAKGEYDSALFYYKNGIVFTAETHLETDLIDDYNGISRIYKAKGNLDSAVWYAKKTLTEKITRTYPVGLLKAANMLADIYELQSKNDSTLKYLRIVISLKDSLFNREKTIAVQNVIFKEQERQREVEATKSKLQREYLTYFLIALLIIAIIITAVIVRNRRIKQLQTIRNSIADDLHDDIGSALSSINIMSELAKQKSPEASPLLTSIGESTTTIQENMSDIVWTIKSGNDRFENVMQRMNQFASEILDAKNIELEFKTDVSLASSKLTMEQRKNFYLFFKEVINNAAKYADAKKVSVCIAQKDHYIEMNISDDGKGFDSSKTFSGNGMNTLKKRAAELNGDFKITSNIHEGTAIQLKFKIT